MLPGGVAARAREELESFADKPWFHRVMTVTTIVFGLIIVAETVTLSVLVFSLPTDRVLLIRPIVRNVAAGLVLLWAFFYMVPPYAEARGTMNGKPPPSLAQRSDPDSSGRYERDELVLVGL